MEKKTFKLETQWGETMDVQLDINNYMNNDSCDVTYDGSCSLRLR